MEQKSQADTFPTTTSLGLTAIFHYILIKYALTDHVITAFSKPLSWTTLKFEVLCMADISEKKNKKNTAS